MQGRLVEGHLTLNVEEGRIDDIELLGLGEHQADDFRDRFAIKPGDVYNKRAVGQAVERLLAPDGRRDRGRPAARRAAGRTGAAIAPDDAILDHRTGRNVLVVPLRWRGVTSSMRPAPTTARICFPRSTALPQRSGSRRRSSITASSTTPSSTATHRTSSAARIPAIRLASSGRSSAGRACSSARRCTTSRATDDLWRLTTIEQTLVSLGFKNTFRDYYRRRGGQLFTAFQARARTTSSALMARWDRHEPLANATDFSFFRDDQDFRPNPLGHRSARQLRWSSATRSTRAR